MHVCQHPSSSYAEYIDFLSKVTPDLQAEFLEQMRRFNLGQAGEADCPVYDGMFDYFQVAFFLSTLRNLVRGQH